MAFPERPVWERPSAWRAEWIWLGDWETPRAFFRRRIELTAKPAKAWLSIAADNAFVLYVNGKQVAAGTDWSVLHRVDLASHLREGLNVLSVACENAGGPGGLVAEGEVTPLDGKEQRLFTSQRWRVSAAEQDGWQAAGFDDSAWEPAQEYGQPPCEPWQDIGEPSPSH